MSKCWHFWGETSPFEVFWCGNTADYADAGPNTSGYWPGSDRLVTPRVDGVAVMGYGYYYGNTYARLEEVTNFPIVRTRNSSAGNCDNCIVIPKKYDCINGQCKESTVYNTPGIFADLATCQGKCSLASNNCDGQCISNDEYAQIQSAISQKQRDCG